MKPRTSPREHRHSNMMTREENECVASLFGPRCESLATTVVQVYMTTPPEHCEWTKMDSGALCLIKDHLKRSYYFRLFCPERRMLLWEHEVYNSIQYNAPKPFFHTFEAQDCIIAFNFASNDEATWLKRVLLEKLETKKQRRERRQQKGASYIREPPTPKPSSGFMSNGVIPPGNSYTSPNFASSITGTQNNHKDLRKKNKKKDEKRPITKADIGAPVDFRHVSHVGWDIHKGFDANFEGQETDSDLKEFFEKAGVSDTQLQDRATRDFIYEFIQHHGGIDRVKNEVSQVGLPPIRPHDRTHHSRHERDGPPPLPQRNTPLTSRAAPPPPPSRTVPAPPPPNQTPPPPPPPPTRALPQLPVSAGPPPPPMPAAPPPPPLPSAPMPPPPPPVEVPQPPRSGGDPHSDLMNSIRAGTTLRKAEVDPEPKVTDSRSDLLSEIRQGIALKPVQPNTKPASSGPSESSNSLADALARALAERSRFIHSDSSDTSDDEEDDEWED